MLSSLSNPWFFLRSQHIRARWPGEATQASLLKACLSPPSEQSDPILVWFETILEDVWQLALALSHCGSQLPLDYYRIKLQLNRVESMEWLKRPLYFPGYLNLSSQDIVLPISDVSNPL